MFRCLALFVWVSANQPLNLNPLAAFRFVCYAVICGCSAVTRQRRTDVIRVYSSVITPPHVIQDGRFLKLTLSARNLKQPYQFAPDGDWIQPRNPIEISCVYLVIGGPNHHHPD